MANQSRYEVVTPRLPDALAKALETEIDLSNTTFVIDHSGVDGTVIPPGENQGPPTDNYVHDTTVNPNEVGDNFAIMKAELASAHDTIADLNGEVARLRAKNMVLENQASSGKFKLLSLLNVLISKI